jgi:hypothetical protein
MPYISIDIDLDDIISDLSGRELQNLVDDLYEDGYYQKKLEKKLNEGYSELSITEQEFRDNLMKLKLNYLSLSNEELEIIEKLAKRF